jgi:hypothetical protein
MTADGFRYYLPAFLLMALDPHARDMAEHVTFVLTDPGDAEATRHERFRARVTSLLPAEKIAVTEVLRLLARECEEGGDPINPAREALDSYWEPAAARA